MIQEGRQFSQDILRELRCLEESPRDFLVVVARHGESAEVVLVDELIEHIGPEDDGGRDVDLNAFESVPDIVVVDERVDEPQATGFAAERPAADARKTAVRIERLL